MFNTSMSYTLREINNFYFLISKNKCVNGKWVYELNETGATIWRLCNQVKNMEELLQRLELVYNKKFNTYESKMIYLYISTMEMEGLLQRENK